MIVVDGIEHQPAYNINLDSYKTSGNVITNAGHDIEAKDLILIDDSDNVIGQ